MASSTSMKRLAFFLLVLVLSSVQIEARINKFFSKFIHTNYNDALQRAVPLPVAPSPAPVSAPPEVSPILSPTPSFHESQNAYGLYARGSDDFEKNPNPTITDVEEEILAEDNDEDSYKSEFPDTKLQGSDFESRRREEQYQRSRHSSNGYGNSEFASNYENNGGRNYEFESDFENNGGRNYESESNFGNGGERQGMSDTRFVENGRYYYNSNQRSGEGESFGSKKSPFEFDTMEEYERSEEFHRP